ncbi:MMPL family transporter [Aliikangiella marina]|uniref:MMPL family transporter n=1 Tax=Aliikangiella marina TaxID=1712262 RepID=A0A545TJE9_9GAMM|nr:MMPL family transporter [Aliikangiella marina]TQV77291.1 MMPL family transporter [Aliikangiella marina]
MIYWGLVLFTLSIGALISLIKVDTDPENMLSRDEPARIYHNQIKQEFALSDLIVVGAVAKTGETIFNPQSLADLKVLSDEIKQIEGVIVKDVNAISTIDNIEQAGEGVIRFEWLMAKAPTDEQSAIELQQKTRRLPFVVNSLVSGDEKAATIYVPIENKDESYRISQAIQVLIEQLSNANEYHITGLPVAEDTFGVEMFIQMGISAPAAAAVIYLLMLYFFRSASLVVAPMIVAMATVIIVMGAMIGMGFTVHIMSSMIPIFLMPIAVVDSVHLMSEFADRYKPGSDAKAEIKKVTQHLFQPMLFTSITSAAGFFSLALTPIPPVQIFGVYVGLGILLAFLVTILFIPAYVSRMNDIALRNMQEKLHSASSADRKPSILARLLPIWGGFSIAQNKLVIIVALVVTAISIVGISKIQINDNPVRWFKSDHQIRVADRVLNHHFAGTYDAHLVLEFTGREDLIRGLYGEVISIVQQAKLNQSLSPESINAIETILSKGAQSLSIQELNQVVDDLLFDESDSGILVLEQIQSVVDESEANLKQFTLPRNLAYIEKLQSYLLETALVGKSNSVVDLVKTVNRELRSGSDSDYAIPETQNAVAQTLLQFQSSHRPQDLWHFVTPDYTKSLIWLQMTSGDNQDMKAVIESVEGFVANNPLPENIELNWAGKAYLNLIWQDKMVAGMFDSLVSAFAIVFIMMVILFRSLLFGLLAMLPLSITIIFMYGMIGWMGKYYDMPIAVLSALTLGLSVDFAIHFIERTRAYFKEHQDWQTTMKLMFEEPARAISRNALVIALGFTPLLLAPLVPYITVGAFLAAIMAVSALVTILVLPASFTLLKGILFKVAK